MQPGLADQGTHLEAPSCAIPLEHRLEQSIIEAWKRPYYRERLGSLERALKLVRSRRFSELPITRKSELRERWNDVMAVGEASDFVSSSGTTGRPLDVPVHNVEERRRVLRVRRLLQELGIDSKSRVLQLLSLDDLFTLGPLAWQAIKEQGASAIRCTPQRLGRVMQVIRYLRPDFVIGNPFTMTRMAERAGALWPPRQALPKRAFLAVAATFDAALSPTPVARAVHEHWGFELMLNQYGASELGPIAFECRSHQGLHVHSDDHYVELVDPVTGAVVEDPDQPGEIVVTALDAPRGFLPVRYAPGDMAHWLKTDRCTCGRTTPRLGAIFGRRDQQLKVMGQTVFPELLLDCGDSCDGVARCAVRVDSDALGADDVTLLLVVATNANGERVEREVAARLAQLLPVCPNVAVTSEAEMTALEHRASEHSNQVKVPRFFDLRGAESTP